MEVYRAVMLTGSIKGAAKMLFASQPAVSRIVSHTEETLGLALFNRVKGKLVPTPEGEALFREVDDFYKHAMRVDEFAKGLSAGGSGVLNVSSSPCLSRSMIAQAITTFTQRYPHIRVNYRVTMLNDMPQEVLSNLVDVAVAVLPLDHPNLTVEPFATGKMVCIVPKDHPLSDRASVSVADLTPYPLIAHHCTIAFGRFVNAAFEQAGVPMQTRIDIHQTELACSLVRAGAGVAIVDPFTIQGMDGESLNVLPLTEEIRLTPCVVRSVFDTRKTHADKFVAVLRECFGQLT